MIQITVRRTGNGVNLPAAGLNHVNRTPRGERRARGRSAGCAVGSSRATGRVLLPWMRLDAGIMGREGSEV